MKKKFLLSTIVACFLQVANAQEQKISKDEMLSKGKETLENINSRKINIETLPYYSFGKGIGITSPDSLFQTNIRFRMQNRVEMDLIGKDDIEYIAVIRRLRLRFDGYVGNPKFLYAIQLSFAPDDVGKVKDNSYVNIIRDAMFFYRATPKLSIGMGQTKLPGNRQRINSSGALDLTDRSINNAYFNIDRDFGFQATYIDSNKKGFGYNFKGAISTGEGRNFNERTSGLAYTGRIELYPLGAFKKNGAFFEGDLQREEKPKIYIGATYHYNNKAIFSQGQRGTRLFEERDLRSVFVDGVMKYNGWALSLAYMNRQTDNPITENLENNQKSYVYAGNGYDTQLSYIFKKNWEVIGRFSQVTPDSRILTWQPEHRQYSFGITKYIWEHSFKAQFEISKNEYNLLNKKDDWYLRFQIEIGI